MNNIAHVDVATTPTPHLLRDCINERALVEGKTIYSHIVLINKTLTCMHFGSSA